MLASPSSVRSLRFGLFVRIVFPLLVVALVLGAWRTWSVVNSARTLFDRNLTTVSVAVARDLASSGGELPSTETLSLLSEASGGRVFYHVHGPDGAYVAGFGYPPRLDRPELVGDAVPLLFDSSHLGRPVRVASLRQFVNSSGLEGFATISVWQEQSVRRDFATRQAMASVAIILCLVGAVMGLVWFGVNAGLAPLNHLRNSVARRSPEDLRAINSAVPEEVTPLVDTLNTLFGEVQYSIEARDRFIGNAAHQLRNPIAAIQATAESAQNAKTPDETQRRISKTVNEAQRASHLAEQLLMLDRLMHAPDREHTEVFDVGPLVAEVTTRFGDRALDQGIEFSLDAKKGPIPIAGDAELFAQALENLLDNSLTHGGPGLNAIEVVLDHGTQSLHLSVSDDGRGIPVEDRELVFERFAQLDFGNGSGLGLAIVKEIVKGHGGTITIQDGLGGQGTTFRVEIPLANKGSSTVRS